MTLLSNTLFSERMCKQTNSVIYTAPRCDSGSTHTAVCTHLLHSGLPHGFLNKSRVMSFSNAKMSLRPRSVVPPISSHTRLKYVLQTGLDMKVPWEEKMPDVPYIIIDDVQISTDPSNWSPLSIKQIVKLQLKPVTSSEFERKGETNRMDPNAAYDGTQFMSDVSGTDYRTYRFWVKHLGYTSGADAVAYMVLARPFKDFNVYRLPLT